MIPEALARAVALIPTALVVDMVELIRRVLGSPSPKDALARALQITAHEKAADAALDAMFAAKRNIPGSGV